MSNAQTLPVVGAALAVPVMLPTIAAIAPPLLLGVGIFAALALLYSDDKPQTATPGKEPAPPAIPPPEPIVKRVGTGWFPLADESAAPPSAPAMTEAERQQRIRETEAELAKERREIARLDAELKRERARIQAASAAVSPQPAARP